MLKATMPRLGAPVPKLKSPVEKDFSRKLNLKICLITAVKNKYPGKYKTVYF